MQVVDAHCHLAGPEHKADPAVPLGDVTVVGRVLCGIQPFEWPAIASTAESWPDTLPAFGVHPWYARTAMGDWLEQLERMLLAHPEAWLGEAGLDFITEHGLYEQQQELFASQLRLARRLERPVNLHCLKAHDKLIELLDQHYLGDAFDMPFIVHSFAGPHQAIQALADRGAYFTVGPLFSRRDSRRQRERTKIFPLDRLLTESDQFVPPGVDAADDLQHTVAWLAQVRGMDQNALATVLTDNWRRIRNGG